MGNFYFIKECKTIQSSILVEKRFLQEGRADECGGIGEALYLDLFSKTRQWIMETILEHYSPTNCELLGLTPKEYIDQHNLLDGRTCIDVSSKNDDIAECDPFVFGKIWLKDAIMLIAKEDLPDLCIKETNTESFDMELIDKYNLLYASVEEKNGKYEVKLFQTFEICMPNTLHENFIIDCK